MQRAIAVCAIAGVCGAFVACSTDTPDPPPPEIIQGRFIDVEGLSYQSGATKGVTDAAGMFRAESVKFVSSPVALSFAGVTLPELASGRVYSQEKTVYLADGTYKKEPSVPIFTPVDLSRNPVVFINVKRVLMMLDRDQNPDNGVAISPAVRSARFSQIDWNTDDLENATAAMVADATSLDGTTHRLPTLDEAIAHLNQTWSCATAGVYKGSNLGSHVTTTGPDGKETTFTGSFSVVVLPGGVVLGEVGFVDKTSSNSFPFYGSLQLETQSATVQFDLSAPVVSAVLSWQSTDSLSGEWQRQDGTKGRVTAERVNPPSQPRYRFVAFPVAFITARGTALDFVLQFDIDGANNIRGGFTDVRLPSDVWQWNGAIKGNTFDAVIGDASSPSQTFAGQVDLEALTITGDLRNYDGAIEQTFPATDPLGGCRL